MNTTRRDVLRTAAGLGGSLALFTFLPGCSVSASDADDASDDDAVDTTSAELVTCQPAVISQNHGHALSVPPADVAAGVSKTYSIAGSSPHDHKVTVSAADFAKLAVGKAITVTSTRAVGHTHSVTVTCAVAPPPPKCGNGARASSITANHGHSLVVPKADALGTVPKTYSIKGTSSHAHSVTITAAQFAKLRTGATVSVTSTTGAGHSHVVVVACA